jgi:hypothetical protein
MAFVLYILMVYFSILFFYPFVYPFPFFVGVNVRVILRQFCAGTFDA